MPTWRLEGEVLVDRKGRANCTAVAPASLVCKIFHPVVPIGNREVFSVSGALTHCGPRTIRRSRAKPFPECIRSETRLPAIGLHHKPGRQFR
jgi:hypothetical protein